MERKDIVKELKKIKDALAEKNKKLNERYRYYFFDSDYEKHMAYVPPRPEEPAKPKEPSVPSNEKDRFLKDDLIFSFAEYKKKNSSNPRFELDGWKFGLTIAGAIIGVFILLVGLVVIGEGNSDLEYAHEWYNSIMNQSQLYNEYMYKIKTANDVIATGVTTLIVGGCIALVPAAISCAVAFITYRINVKNNNEKMARNYKTYCANTKLKNEEKEKNKNTAINDYKDYENRVALYKNKMKEYEENLKAYKLKFDAYQDAYDAQLELAKNKVNKHNQNIESTAEANFEKALSAIKIEFPEKYYYAIEKIIDIFEDFRADTLKEAINVLKEDEHKQSMLNEQRRLVDLQEEYNAELERQGEETARYQQEQEEMQRERMRQEQRYHEENLSFQREQARKQQEAERRRLDEQRAFQREQENRQREAERREQDRIKQIRGRCVLCANRFTCSIKNSITSACPSFRSK